MTTRTLTCLNGKEKVTVFVAENNAGYSFWYAIKGGHTVHLTCKKVKSMMQLNLIPDVNVFTYYGNGSKERPDNIADVETFKWLLRDK